MCCCQQLFDAVARKDVRSTLLVLAHSTSSVVNLPYSDADLRTPLHIAAAIGDVVLVQLLVWVSFSKFCHRGKLFLLFQYCYLTVYFHVASYSAFICVIINYYN